MKGNCLSEAQVYGCFVLNEAATILIDQEQNLKLKTLHLPCITLPRLCAVTAPNEINCLLPSVVVPCLVKASCLLFLLVDWESFSAGNVFIHFLLSMPHTNVCSIVKRGDLNRCDTHLPELFKCICIY